MPGSKSKPTRSLPELHADLGIPLAYAAERKLSLQPEPDLADLVEVGITEEGRSIRLIRPAAAAWAAMRETAARDDIELIALSGFRSIARQTEIIRGKLAAGHAMADILRYVAAPGYSEHHTGRALDIGSPDHLELDEQFGETDAFRWLARRAGQFGFTLSYPRDNPHGIGYEPWHWLWRP